MSPRLQVLDGQMDVFGFDVMFFSDRIQQIQLREMQERQGPAGFLSI